MLQQEPSEMAIAEGRRWGGAFALSLGSSGNKIWRVRTARMGMSSSLYFAHRSCNVPTFDQFFDDALDLYNPADEVRVYLNRLTCS